MTEGPFETVQRARGLAREWVSDQGFVSHVYRGFVDPGGTPATVHFTGRKRFSADCQMLFEGVPTRVAQAEQEAAPSKLRFLFDRRQRRTEEDRSEITMADTFMTKTDHKDALLFSPHVDAVLPLEANMDLQLQRLRSNGTRKKMQALFHRGFAWRFSNDLQDFNLFYEQMYLPTVQFRFGDTGTLCPREEMEHTFTHGGGLVLACADDGTPQGAALLNTAPHNASQLHCWKTGVARCDRLTGAELTDCYARVEAATLQYAVAQGFHSIHYGVTRALLTDGVFEHKRRLGCDFQKNGAYLEAALRVKAAVKAQLLAARPLMLWRGPQLYGWVGQAGEVTAGASANALRERLLFGGLSGLRGVSLFTSGVAASRTLMMHTVEEAVRLSNHAIEVIEEA